MSQLTKIALQYLGFPAVQYTGPNEGQTPEGFTCSGFIQFVLREAGIDVPNWHSNEFFDRFGILVHEGLQKSGDLVFESKYGLKPNHVEFYVSIDTLSVLLDTEDLRIPKEKISDFLATTNSDNFMLGCPGRDDSKIRLTELERSIIIPNPKYNHLPQLYNINPIGYKRPAVLHPGKRYHKILP
ncbi:MAG: NlpC/P60 family protein [Nanoarchaeota archaeon]